MTNYYEELKLNKSDSLDEIQKQLSQLESTWKRREITNPEKATQMLAMLIEARKAFKDSASRAEYERALASSDSEPKDNDPNAERRKQLNKWYNDADSYLNRKEYDLAKSAIEKALAYIDPTTEDPKVYDLAARIYRDNREYPQALNYANKAIVLEPSVGKYYLTKGIIISDQSLEANAQGRYIDGNTLTQNARNTIQTAIGKARTSGDNYTLGIALGVLAFSLYRHNPTDIQQAEQLAIEAQSVGDSWGNAKIIVDELNSQREAAARAEQEKRDREQEKRDREKKEAQQREENRRQEIYKSAMMHAAKNTIAECEIALKRLDDIRGWKDVDERIESIQKKIDTLKETQKVRKRRLTFAAVTLGIILISIIATNAIRSDIERHRAGENVTWSYKGTTGTLTIEGSGEIEEAKWDKERKDIEKIVIKDGITTIPDSAFRDCNNLIKVDLPNSISAIGKNAFRGCRSLQEINLPNNLVSIKEEAFAETGIISINIPASVKAVTSSVFHDTFQLQAVEVDSDNTNFCSIDGILYDKAVSHIIKVPAKKDVSSMSFPETVTAINTEAFSYNISSNIVLPNGVKTIGERAFLQCQNLETLYIPTGINTIGIHGTAFTGCFSLKQIFFAGNSSEWSRISTAFKSNLPNGCVVQCADGEYSSLNSAASSSAVSGSMSTEEPEKLTETIPNITDVWLTDLDYYMKDSKVQVKGNATGKTNTGVEYSHYMFAELPYSEITYKLDGKYSKLSAKWAICFNDRNTTDNNSFGIYADGVLIYESPVISGGDLPVDVSVDLGNCNILTVMFKQGSGAGELGNIRLYKSNTIPSSSEFLQIGTLPTWLTNTPYFYSKGATVKPSSLGTANTGEQYSHYVFGRKDSYVDYYLNGAYDKLSGIWTICYKNRDTTTNEAFEIYADGKCVYSSPALTGGDTPISVEADINYCQILRIVFTSGTGCGEFGNIRISSSNISRVFPIDPITTIVNRPGDWLTAMNYLTNQNVTVRDTSTGRTNTGVEYSHYLFGRSNSVIEYYLQGKYARLTGLWTICEKNKDTGTEEAFEIYADEILVYSSPILTGGDLPVEVNADIANCERLRIVFTSGTGCGEFGNIKVS